MKKNKQQGQMERPRYNLDKLVREEISIDMTFKLKWKEYIAFLENLSEVFSSNGKSWEQSTQDSTGKKSVLLEFVREGI